MDAFTAHQLRFECEALEPMELYEWQGSGLRGALYRALWGNFCMNRDATECAACPLVQTCPVAFLVATLDPNSERGVKVPRPYTLEPPPPGTRSAGARAVIQFRPDDVRPGAEPLPLRHPGARADGAEWYMGSPRDGVGEQVE